MASKTQKTPLNSASLGELKRQRKRTGLGSVSIVKLLEGRTAAPAPHVIDNWLSGSQALAELAQFEMVLMAYAGQPSLSSDGTGPDYVALTGELRDELRQIHAKSASGYLDAAPIKFSPSQMSHILSGRKKKVSRIMLEFFRNEALDVPAKAVSHPYPPSPDLQEAIHLPARPERKYGPRVPPKGIEYVQITDALHTKLHAHIARTRVSPRLLLKSLPGSPAGLTIATVQSWHSGKIQSAEKHYFEFVMKQYAKLPSA